MTIDGPVANVTVEQTFRSAVDRELEGTYLFPLPEGAAVSRFAMTMGGKLVEGEVMDAAEGTRHLRRASSASGGTPGCSSTWGAGSSARACSRSPRAAT